MDALKRIPQKAALINQNEKILSILLIVFLGLITYGVMLPWLGFYYDDWPFLWVVNSQGIEGLIPYTATDRPALAVPYTFAYLLAGNQPLLWHGLNLIVHILTAILLLWAVRGVWPERRLETTMIAVFYMVYPGFLGRPIALIYTSHNLTLALIALSLGCAVWSLRTNDRAKIILLTLAGCIACLSYLFLIEFFIGVEILRIVFIILLINQENLGVVQRIKSFFLKWWPYLLTVMVFLYWRLFIYVSLRSETDISLLGNQYKNNPIGLLARIPIETTRSFIRSTFLAWFSTAYSLFQEAPTLVFVASILLGILGFAAIILYWRLTARKSDQQLPAAGNDANTRKWAVQNVCTGLFVSFLSLLPVILAGREVQLLNVGDRYTMPAIIGISLLVTSLLFLLPPNARRFAIGFLVALSISTHFNNAYQYQANWKSNRDLWWQLAWRAPEIRPGTFLVIDQNENFNNFGYTVWARANLIYTKPSELDDPIYGDYLSEEIAQKIYKGGAEMYGAGRKLRFRIDYDSPLVITRPTTSSCLTIVDPLLDTSAKYTPLVRSLIPYSRKELIEASGKTNENLLTTIYGKEPEHTWCFYFQKAELARQLRDWPTIIEQYEAVDTLGLTPQDATEWLPFFEANVRLGNWEEVDPLIPQVREMGDVIDVSDPYCRTLQNLKTELPQDKETLKRVEEAGLKLQCVR